MTDVPGLTDLAAHGGLFLSAFGSATLLPGTSEAALLALLGTCQGGPASLLLTATAGNVLGSVVNWALGRRLAGFGNQRWSPAKGRAIDRAVAWSRRYGAWTLLLSWLPVVGDALTLAAGALRVSFPAFLILVTLGKGGRYVFILAGYLWWSGGA